VDATALTAPHISHYHHCGGNFSDAISIAEMEFDFAKLSLVLHCMGRSQTAFDFERC
jgi:hypothetical protein